jgi:transcriptional regulator
MYLPKQFEETSVPVLLNLIKAHPLATVITLSASGLNANHIPMVLAENANGQTVLRGHAARALPWSVNDAPADFLDQIKQAIVGFEVQIESMVGKWKVSQNQPPRNRATVVQGLEGEGTDQALRMRDLVKKNL